MLFRNTASFVSTDVSEEPSATDSKLAPCDADTVRVLKSLLTYGGGHRRDAFYVVWSEEGTNHQRRFDDYDSARFYVIKLTCRLEIDALNRECALIAQYQRDHPKRGSGGGSTSSNPKEVF